MGYVTPNIGIYIADSGETNYAASSAAGMINIDGHDHSGGPNKGVPITSSGLADFSVTYEKLNSNVVDPTTGVGVNSTPGLQNQIQMLGILKNIYQVSSSGSNVGFMTMNGAVVTNRTFQNTTSIIWTNPAGTGGNPSANVGLIDVSQGGTGLSSLTPYAILLGGTTGTGNVQQPALGNAGDVLMSQGAGMPPAFTPPGSLTGAIQYSTVTATAAEMTNLAASPITLASAPGAGKVLVPLFCYGVSNFVGAGFAGTGTNAPKIAYNNSANAIAMTFGGSAFLGTTSNGYCWTTQNPNATSLPPVAPQADVQNQALTLSQFSTDWTGGGTSTITFMLAYLTITL